MFILARPWTARPRAARIVGLLMLIVLLAGIAGALGNGPDRVAQAAPSHSHPGANGVPYVDHVVIVMEENHSYGQVLGTPTSGTPGLPGVLPGDPGQILDQDTYLRSLAAGGASFTHASAETHPSQPNYLALFSGSTQGLCLRA